eukprot:SAG11_NODE_5055_length_1677_cov_2.511407_1_plen_54_part_01
MTSFGATPPHGLHPFPQPTGCEGGGGGGGGRLYALQSEGGWPPFRRWGGWMGGG